jgi:hypothetical protein
MLIEPAKVAVAVFLTVLIANGIVPVLVAVASETFISITLTVAVTEPGCEVVAHE